MRDQYALTYNPASNSLIVAGGLNATATGTMNGNVRMRVYVLFFLIAISCFSLFIDIYSFNLTSSTWTTISSAFSSWIPVRYVNAIYSPVTKNVLVWGGSDILYTKQKQMLVVSALGVPTVIPNLGVARDIYSVGRIGNSIIYYGGDDVDYFNTLYDYEVWITMTMNRKP